MNRRVQWIVAAAVLGAAIGARLAAGRSFDVSPPPLKTGLSLALALWVVWGIYWEVKAKESAPAATSESSLSRGLHIVLLNVAMAIVLLPIPGLRARWLPLSTLGIVTGLLIEALGVALAIWARQTLGRNWSGEVRVAADHRLVRTGPYRVVRHPIYSGLFAIVIGTGIVWGEVHSLVGLALLALAYWRKIGMEERALRAAFGREYDAYHETTWSLIPRVL